MVGVSTAPTLRLRFAAWLVAIAAWLAGDTRPKATPTAVAAPVTHRTGAGSYRIGRYSLCHEHATVVITPKGGPSEGLQWTLKTCVQWTLDSKAKWVHFYLCYAEAADLIPWMGSGWAKTPVDITVTWAFPGRRPFTDVCHGLLLETISITSAKGDVVVAAMCGRFERLTMSYVGGGGITPEVPGPTPGQLKAERQEKLDALIAAWPDFTITHVPVADTSRAIVMATATVNDSPYGTSIECDVADVEETTAVVLERAHAHLREVQGNAPISA